MMSREIEQFYKDWPPEQYGNIGRWVDPPPGRQCPVCKADMFLLPNGVTYSCSECKYMEQIQNSHVPLKFNSSVYKGHPIYEAGYDAGYLDGKEEND